MGTAQLPDAIFRPRLYYQMTAMSNQSRLREILVYHLPLVLYAALIIFVSSLSHLKSPEIGPFSLDKLAHTAEYALLAFLMVRSFSQLAAFRRWSSAALVSLLILVIFAAADEYHQKFVAGRNADGFDLLADIFGGSVVILIYYLRLRGKRQEGSDDLLSS